MEVEMRSDLTGTMSPISLLHAIGLLLLLLPPMPLADYRPDESYGGKHEQGHGGFVLFRKENDTNLDQVSSSSSSGVMVTFPMTFGLRPSFNFLPTGLRTHATVTSQLEQRRFRRNSVQNAGGDGPSPSNDDEPLQLPSSSRIVGPYFESNKTSVSISARAGTTVMLDCAVALLQGRTVSWLRKKPDSVQLLTVGNATYSSDSRHGLYFRYPNNWRLGINQVSKVDEGIYECQLSTHPTKALVFHLKVIAPAVQILDDNEHVITERHYKVDSALHLTCRASQLDKAADSLSWFKGDRSLPGGDSRIKVKPWKNQTNGEASSFLSIVSVRQGDSGTYSCRTAQASNTVIVHVLNEKLPAAVQHENSAKMFSFSPFSLVLTLLLFPILISV